MLQTVHVFSSSANLNRIYSNFTVFFFFSCQARGETAVRQEFPEATIVRPATFFGHEDHFLNYYACK